MYALRWVGTVVFTLGLTALLLVKTVSGQSVIAPYQPNQVDEFVAAAQRGGLVRLAHGVFELTGTLLLQHKVEIVGAGQGFTTLRFKSVPYGASAITFNGSGTFELSKMTVEVVSGGANVVLVQHGEFDIRDVTLSGPQLSDSGEIGIGSTGIHVIEGARGVIRNALLFNNVVGFWADGNATVNVLHSNIVSNSVGVVFAGSASGIVRNSKFEHNALGVVAAKNAHVAIEGNSLKDLDSEAILFSDSTSGIIRNNIIEFDSSYGVRVIGAAQVTVRSNTLTTHGDEYAAVVFEDSASGTVWNNTIKSSHSIVIQCWDSASGRIIGNVLQNSGGDAFSLQNTSCTESGNNVAGPR